MLKRILLVVCCTCGLAFISFAQKNEDKANHLPPEGPHIKLRFSPLAMLEPDPGVMLGGEWRFNERFSIGLDAAYLYWSSGEPGSGYKIRPELRYYFAQRTKLSWFAAAEASYKRLTTPTSREMCVGPNCAYLQRVDYKEVKSAPGGSVKIGFQQYFNKKQKLFYECFLGLGFKVVNRFKKDYNPPPGTIDSEPIDAPFMFFIDGFSPHIPAGIKFGLRL